MKTCAPMVALLLLAFGTHSSAQSDPVRLRLMSYDINPKRPWDITVAVNITPPGKTHFLTVGTKIPGTNWVIKGFTKKESPGPDGTKNDTSEITIEDATTKEAVNLPLSKPIDSKPTF